MLQQRQLDGAVGLRDADGIGEIAQRFGRVTPPPDAGNRRHAGIVPAAHMPILHQREQLALTQQGISQIEPVEFDLLRMIDP